MRMTKMIKMIKDTFVRDDNTLRQWSNRLTSINKQIKQTPHNHPGWYELRNNIITVVNNKIILFNMKNQNEQITIKEKRRKRDKLR